MNKLFLATVALPTVLSALYFGLMASDVYISESSFVVRSPQTSSSSGLGSLMQVAGFSRSEDTYPVRNFILSRDALHLLDAQLAIKQAFSAPGIDRVSRFGGLDADNSTEALLRYYQKQVSVDYDTSSAITTVSVKAFTAQTAQQINAKLLALSEDLVNQLNARGRNDLVQSATTEVADAEKHVAEATLAVSDYRKRTGMFDTEKQSALQLAGIAKLQDELITASSRLNQLRTLSKDSPQIPVLINEVANLQGAIQTQTAKVAGGPDSLAEQSADYGRLVLQRGFAEKQLTAAMAALEHARNDGHRKHVYLERITQPSLPDSSVEPRRIRNVLATLGVGLLLWGVLSLLLAGIREHQD